MIFDNINDMYLLYIYTHTQSQFKQYGLGIYNAYNYRTIVIISVIIILLIG